MRNPESSQFDGAVSQKSMLYFETPAPAAR